MPLFAGMAAVRHEPFSSQTSENADLSRHLRATVCSTRPSSGESALTAAPLSTRMAARRTLSDPSCAEDTHVWHLTHHGQRTIHVIRENFQVKAEMATFQTA